jgi:hypothetical protein
MCSPLLLIRLSRTTPSRAARQSGRRRCSVRRVGGRARRLAVGDVAVDGVAAWPGGSPGCWGCVGVELGGGSFMIAGVGTGTMTEVEVLVCPSSLRRHQRAGQSSPHKSLLVLYVLGQLAAIGASAVAWSAAVEKLADLNHDVGSDAFRAQRQKKRAGGGVNRGRCVWRCRCRPDLRPRGLSR